MPMRKLREFLDQHDVHYTTMSHSPAFTAQEIAAEAHVKGQELAKTVMVTLDGRMHMLVLPASRQVDFDQLREATGAKRIALATEQEFRGLFPGAEVGAMPPFGNLFGLPVLVADDLAEDERISFNAGTHTELVRMRYADFERLVAPRRLPICTPV